MKKLIVFFFVFMFLIGSQSFCVTHKGMEYNKFSEGFSESRLFTHTVVGYQTKEFRVDIDINGSTKYTDIKFVQAYITDGKGNWSNQDYLVAEDVREIINKLDCSESLREEIMWDIKTQGATLWFEPRFQLIHLPSQIVATKYGYVYHPSDNLTESVEKNVVKTRPIYDSSGKHVDNEIVYDSNGQEIREDQTYYICPQYNYCTADEINIVLPKRSYSEQYFYLQVEPDTPACNHGGCNHGNVSFAGHVEKTIAGRTVRGHAYDGKTYILTRAERCELCDGYKVLECSPCTHNHEHPEDQYDQRDLEPHEQPFTISETMGAPRFIGQSFNLIGSGHVGGTTNYEVGNPEVITCGISCPICASFNVSYTCSQTYNFCRDNVVDYDVSTHKVKIEFVGFDTDKGKSIEVGEANSFSDYGELTEEIVDTIAYNRNRYDKYFKITKFYPEELEINSVTGIAKGKIIANCSITNCSICSEKVIPIYFRFITDGYEGFIEEFKLTVISEDEGKYGYVGINSNPTKSYDSGEFAEGSNQMIRAIAKEGYEFSHWEEYNNPALKLECWEESIKMPDIDYILVARFKPIIKTWHKVTAMSDGNGEVKIDDNQGKRIEVLVEDGGSVIINAIPNDDFELDYWEYKTGDRTSTSTVSALKLENIKGDYIVVAHFKPIVPNEYYKLTVLSPIGTTYGGTEYAVARKEYPVGVILSEEESEKWSFNGWFSNEIDTDNLGNECEVTMPKMNVTMEAKFTEKKEYRSLTVKSDGNGTVQIGMREPVRDEDTDTFVKDTEVIIIADPDDGYEFIGWYDEKDKEISKKLKEKVTVDENKVYRAKFEFVGYTLEVRSAGNDGLVQIENYTLKEYDKLERIELGKKIVIHAYPDPGAEFVSWERDGQEERIENAEYTITMTKNEKFTAYFGYKLTVKTDGEGAVRIDDRTPVSEMDTIVVEPGSEHRITAYPFNEDFINWTAPGVVIDEKEATVKVNSDIVYVAHFKNHDLTVVSAGNGLVAIDEEELANEVTIKATKDSKHIIKAIPDKENGYMFDCWKIVNENGEEVLKEDWKEEQEITMPDSDLVVKAYFKRIDTYVTITVKTADENRGLVSINGGEHQKEITTTVKVGEKITITAHPIGDNSFAYWLEDTKKTVSFDIEATVDATYTAYFGLDYYSLTVKVGENGGGKVTIGENGEGKDTYTIENAIPGSEYLIKAIQNTNYEFVYWKDTLNNEKTKYTKEDNFIMPESDVILEANFYKIIPGDWELNLYKDEGVREVKAVIDGVEYTSYNSISKRVKKGATVVISATPKNNYTFVGWFNDNGSSKYREMENTFTMNGNVTLTASAERIPQIIESFKILSIRDIRWKDYFARGGNYIYFPTNMSSTDVVSSANLVDKAYNQYKKIVFGYAVEFEMITSGVPLRDVNRLLGNVSSEDGVVLSITPKIYEREGSDIGRQIKEYDTVKSNVANDVKQYMITAKETKGTNNGVEYPVVTWSWVYYLPINVYEDIAKSIDEDSDIIVALEIKLLNKDNEVIYNYNKSLETLYDAKKTSNMFTYRMDLTLMDDIRDNATN